MSVPAQLLLMVLSTKPQYDPLDSVMFAPRYSMSPNRRPVPETDYGFSNHPGP